ncbi:MAG: dephospho-CoA kinase [Gammaproteobacteria bacterium]|nr:dephospho-CoA kinase [Gammaproteobacteria bacterium]
MTVLIIGLTGGIGSGKSTVANYFAGLGITIIDADKIAHELTQPNSAALAKIVKHFGAEVLADNGALNRAYLRQLIFQDNKAKEWLEKLLHPLIYKIIKQQAAKASSAYCILVVPLLLETKHESWVDRILVADAPEELQIKRAIERDNISITTAKSMLKAQLPRAKRLAAADDIIENSGSLDHLKRQVITLHQKYLKRALQEQTCG